MWENKTVLITGGTGSFGRRFVKLMLEAKAKKIIVFSRDEWKHYMMQQEGFDIDYFIGDVRDIARLNDAFRGVDIVVHAAALKQVPLGETNPAEVIKTNVLGTQNVIEAALLNNVEKVFLISSDKAVQPVNLYGATKMAAEKLIIAANYRSNTTMFSASRYGNVIGSRGSVFEIFEKQIPTGVITVTNPRMTRFWLTLKQGTTYVKNCIEVMKGGEIFVPHPPASSIETLVKAIAPTCEINIIGSRPGEKEHEILVSKEELACSTWENGFTIRPPPQKLDIRYEEIATGDFSSGVARTLTVGQLRQLLEEANQ